MGLDEKVYIPTVASLGKDGVPGHSHCGGVNTDSVGRGCEGVVAGRPAEGGGGRKEEDQQWEQHARRGAGGQLKLPM